MEDVKIIYATEQDSALIAEISRETFYDTFASANSKENMDKFMNETFSNEQLKNEVGKQGNIFLLAYENDHPVGYAFLKENSNAPELVNTDCIEISRIYVRIPFIGKGIGKKLMQKCIDIAQQKMRSVLWLGVWEKNRSAIDFYEKWGFEKFSTHFFQLGDDEQTDWLMKKRLT